MTGKTGSFISNTEICFVLLDLCGVKNQYTIGNSAITASLYGVISLGKNNTKLTMLVPKDRTKQLTNKYLELLLDVNKYLPAPSVQGCITRNAGKQTT